MGLDLLDLLGRFEYVRFNSHGAIFAFGILQVPHLVNFMLFIVLILISFNLLGARLFGELEFWFSIIKVVTIVAMVIVDWF